MGSFSIWHWLIVLLIVVLVFGTKKLRNIGSDVGGAVKNFKDAMAEENRKADASTLNTLKNDTTENLIMGEAVEVPAEKAAPRRKTTTAKPASAATGAKPKAPAKPKAAASSKPK